MALIWVRPWKRNSEKTRRKLHNFYCTVIYKTIRFKRYISNLEITIHSKNPLSHISKYIRFTFNRLIRAKITLQWGSVNQETQYEKVFQILCFTSFNLDVSTNVKSIVSWILTDWHSLAPSPICQRLETSLIVKNVSGRDIW